VNIGDPIREFEVEPVVVPLPERKEKEPAPRKEPVPEPEKVPA
jgi:hypothetical protein